MAGGAIADALLLSDDRSLCALLDIDDFLLYAAEVVYEMIEEGWGFIVKEARTELFDRTSPLQTPTTRGDQLEMPSLWCSCMLPWAASNVNGFGTVDRIIM